MWRLYKLRWKDCRLGLEKAAACDGRVRQNVFNPWEKARLRYVDLVDVQHVPASDSKVCITKLFH